MAKIVGKLHLPDKHSPQGAPVEPNEWLVHTHQTIDRISIGEAPCECYGRPDLCQHRIAISLSTWSFCTTSSFMGATSFRVSTI